MGEVVSLNISEIRGVDKNRVFTVNAIKDWGIEGDAHSGDWDRQVSIFPIEALEKVPLDKKREVEMGGYTENITISGIPLESLNAGTILKIGEALIEIFYIGKDEYKENGRPYIVSREGRFGKVIESGKISIGDMVNILK